MKYRIDLSDQTAVAVCDCTQRFLGVSRTAVLQRLAEHERTWHPADYNVRQAVEKQATRARKRAMSVR